ncbi:MAG TPA: glycosyltransferase family 39 protein [Terriglobia bacterium]|nr:glycosyltransferase family 39 protein [Terriglobia bacterium]
MPTGSEFASTHFEARINAHYRGSFCCRIVARLHQLGGRPVVLLLLFACVYFVGFGLIAAKAGVSNDELFTLYIARLPHFRDIWAALATGAEQTPPLFYAISRADIHLVGTSGLGLRLPELLAFALMCVCVFHVVARRSSAAYGLLAVLFPFMTAAFNYVFEARAYAMVLAFSAFGLLCWVWAAEGRHRIWALIGLAASLAAAMSCHYYAVLSLFPLGLGEAIRSLRRQSLDAAVWLALGLSLSPLLMFLPLIQSARKFAPHFWAKPQWSSMAYFYDHFLLAPSAIPLLVIFLAIVAYRTLRRSDANASHTPLRASVPVHEIAAVIGFLLIPVVSVILAKTVIGAFSDRYALPAVIGLAITIAWGLHSALEARRAPAVALGLLLLAILAIKEVQTYRRVAVDDLRRTQTYSFLERYAGGDAPIVISDPAGFMELSYDAPTSLARRLTYLADARLALQYTRSDDAEKGLVEMRSWAGLNVQKFREFIASGRRCYVYVINYPDHQYGWVVPGLEAAHWRVVLERWQGAMILFSAVPADSAQAGEVPRPVAEKAP